MQKGYIDICIPTYFVFFVVVVHFNVYVEFLANWICEKLYEEQESILVMYSVCTPVEYKPPLIPKYINALHIIILRSKCQKCNVQSVHSTVPFIFTTLGLSEMLMLWLSGISS